LAVHRQRAVHKAGARYAGAEIVDGFLGRLDHARVVRQPEIVIRADHDDLASLVANDGSFRVLKGNEERVEAHGLSFASACEFLRLAEDIHALLFDGVHAWPPYSLGYTWSGQLRCPPPRMITLDRGLSYLFCGELTTFRAITYTGLIDIFSVQNISILRGRLCRTPAAWTFYTLEEERKCREFVSLFCCCWCWLSCWRPARRPQRSLRQKSPRLKNPQRTWPRKKPLRVRAFSCLVRVRKR